MDMRFFSLKRKKTCLITFVFLSCSVYPSAYNYSCVFNSKETSGIGKCVFTSAFLRLFAYCVYVWTRVRVCVCVLKAVWDGHLFATVLYPILLLCESPLESTIMLEGRFTKEQSASSDFICTELSFAVIWLVVIEGVSAFE